MATKQHKTSPDHSATAKRYKVEPHSSAGALAAREWWVATPGDLGDFIVARDLGPAPSHHDGIHLYQEQGTSRRACMEETPEGLRVVSFPDDKDEL